MRQNFTFVQDVCKCLSNICALKYDYNSLPPHVAICDLNEPFDPKEGLIWGTDTIGRYYPCANHNRIRLFQNRIEAFSKHAEVGAEAVMDVVLIHELAHSVQHLGTSKENIKPHINDWNYWDTWRCEVAAEAATFLYVWERLRGTHLDVIRILNERSPEPYKSRWHQILDIQYDNRSVRSDCGVGKLNWGVHKYFGRDESNSAQPYLVSWNALNTRMENQGLDKVGDAFRECLLGEYCILTKSFYPDFKSRLGEVGAGKDDIEIIGSILASNN